MRDLHAVRTPENVRFEFELAGLAARAVAWAIDFGVMGASISVASGLISVFGGVLAEFANALYIVVWFAIQWGYCAVLEWRWSGQTVGKRIMGIRVVSTQGTPIGLGAAALRNLLRVVDLLPGAYLVGALSVLTDARARRIGDMAADTIVIRTRYSARSAPIVATFVGSKAPPDAAQWARVLTPLEHETALALAARREQLPASIRCELYIQLAEHFERRLGVSRPHWQSHERFVLSLPLLAAAHHESQNRVRPT